MSITIHFLLGFITSFLGTLTPSMLNMTTAKISLTKSKADAIKFAIGVSLVVLIQVYVAILFTKFLRNNPAFVQSLQKIAMVIFAGLSFYFYRESKKQKEATYKERAGNSFVVGLLLSALNMFSIPFYCGVTTALDVAGWLKFSQFNILIFVIGSALGTFTLLAMYASYAKIIQAKAKGLAKNLNLILSILTGVLALFTLLKLWI
ncbi:LysE family transporter [Lutibacter sp.]|uniref:LysE family transporter n=1 Tax=Lutibacter sp. TaxID=1925666 RepID=UPI0025C5417F|nr:LysE family transporter [Lutibacter sp.]MCF6181461.1 LysE family transporter [Lutibacter sp.]